MWQAQESITEQKNRISSLEINTSIYKELISM